MASSWHKKAEDGLGWPSGSPWEAPRAPQEAPKRPKMSSGTPWKLQKRNVFNKKTA